MIAKNFERTLTLRLNAEESEQLRWLMERTGTRVASKALVQGISVLRKTLYRQAQYEDLFDRLNQLARSMHLVATEMQAQTARTPSGPVLPEEPAEYIQEEVWERLRIRTTLRKSLIELVVLQRWICARCGGPLSSDAREVEIDHIIPRSQAGSSDRDNLQAVCASCNRLKGAGNAEDRTNGAN